MLYHFTSCESFLKIILCNELRFSRSMNLDDPFERLRHRNYSDWKSSIEPDAPAAKYLGYFNSLVDQTNILCFFDSVNEKNEVVHPLADLKMWSHYGRLHKGCCIVVNKQKAIAAFSKNIKPVVSEHGRVEYSDLKNYQPAFTSIFAQTDYKDELFKRLFHTLFFSKAAHYSGENEYRFVIHNRDREAAFNILPLVERIVIAENTANGDARSIIALCELFEFEVGKMVVSDDRLEYRRITTANVNA